MKWSVVQVKENIDFMGSKEEGREKDGRYFKTIIGGSQPSLKYSIPVSRGYCDGSEVYGRSKEPQRSRGSESCWTVV